MYALKAAEYLRILEFPTGLRSWIRSWLDGLHVGTHLHWRFSPFSVLGLARTWAYLSSLDEWGPQREAIVAMADRRRTLGSYVGDMPDIAAAHEDWERFFERQVSELPGLCSRAIEWHRERLVSGALEAEPLEEIQRRQNELAAALLLAGYSSDDLFNRVKGGVIDVSELQGEPVEVRLLGFLDYFSRPEPREYVVWTFLSANTGWSATTARRFSKLLLRYAWESAGSGPAAVFLADAGALRPAVVSKLSGTNSVKERHRLAALSLLESAMRREQRLGALTLEAETYMVLATETERAPWCYPMRPYAIPLLADAASALDAEGLRVGQAAQELFDYPQRVIGEVFAAWEHGGVRKFWLTIPPSYHRCLRTDLGYGVHIYRKRLSGVFSRCQPASLPPGVRLIADDSLRDHAELLKQLSAVAPCEDLVLASRLAEIVSWPHFAGRVTKEEQAFNSVCEIAGLLTLARGFRNALGHKSTIPFDVYPLAVYLATASLYAYSSRTRDARQRASTDTTSSAEAS